LLLGDNVVCLVWQGSRGGAGHKIRKTINTRVKDAVTAIALCHNVTPVTDSEQEKEQEHGNISLNNNNNNDDDHQHEDEETHARGKVTYQASSPDEIALVKFAESVHLTLHARDVNLITLQNPLNELEVRHTHAVAD
jgi:phospholipid-translocating ATPase